MARLGLDRALGRVRIGGGQGRPDALQADAVVEQGGRIEGHPHRRQGRAADVDIPDPRELGHFLLHHRGGGIVELARRQGVGGEPQDQDRRVGRVELPVGRVRAERRGQVGPRGIDRRLDVPRRTVDVPVQAEHQHKPHRAEGTRRGHLGDVGDGTQAPLQGRRHGGRHGLRRGAGHLRLDQDDGKIHLGQRRHRQLHEGEDAGEEHADGEQRGGDGPPDERLGDVHGSASTLPAPPSRRPEMRRSRRSKAR
ncbi:hypothetical protein CFIICLFH_5034 [Methylobacterium goesingense]|nr:hypothetical protein CFIICLFH_5034 [Methylobacterium goesingense]